MSFDDVNKAVLPDEESLIKQSVNQSAISPIRGSDISATPINVKQAPNIMEMTTPERKQENKIINKKMAS